jgi:hypothetical protein
MAISLGSERVFSSDNWDVYIIHSFGNLGAAMRAFRFSVGEEGWAVCVCADASSLLAKAPPPLPKTPSTPYYTPQSFSSSFTVMACISRRLGRHTALPFVRLGAESREGARVRKRRWGGRREDDGGTGNSWGGGLMLQRSLITTRPFSLKCEHTSA